MRIVRGTPKDYAWGRVDGLTRWSGRATGAPQAELWFGAHPDGPGVVAAGPEAGRRLDEMPEHAGMPMLKLLAAATPLSLQVHPDGPTAEAGWARDRDRPDHEARFADAAEKSEMLIALEPFDVHAGWRDATEAAAVLDRAGAPRDTVDLVRRGDRRAAIRSVLDLPSDVRAPIERALVGAVSAEGWDPAAISALARVAATHPGDPGVLATVLLQHRVLDPGAAIAVPAGVLHSYVDGLGIEVMTSSDNVLRLGLTAKSIAVDEALAALRDDRGPLPIAAGPEPGWLAPPMPFAVALGSDEAAVEQGTHRIALALEGELRVTDERGETVIDEGLAAVWAPDEGSARVASAGRFVAVTGAAEPSTSGATAEFAQPG